MDKREADLPVDGMQASGGMQGRGQRLTMPLRRSSGSCSHVQWTQAAAVRVQATERQQGKPWFSYSPVMLPVTL